MSCWTTQEGRQFIFPQELQINLHPPASAARLRRRNREAAAASAPLPSADDFNHLLEAVDENVIETAATI